MEQGFDKLFFYNRIQTESFDYYNRMKNYNVSDQLNMQEQLISDESRMNTDEKIELNEHKQDNSVVNQQSASHDNKKRIINVSIFPNWIHPMR